MCANAPRPTVFASGCRPRPDGRFSAHAGPRGVDGSPSDRPDGSLERAPGWAHSITGRFHGAADVLVAGPCRAHRRLVCPGHGDVSPHGGLCHRSPGGDGRRPEPPAASDTCRRARIGTQPRERGVPGERLPERLDAVCGRAPGGNQQGDTAGACPPRRESPGEGRMKLGTAPAPEHSAPAPSEADHGRGPIGRVAISAIRGYQVARLGRPTSCRFAPTCSSYAVEAIRRHGPWSGGRLALRRLLRCHPWGGHGFDPVPERRAP
jgi:putative membrane protein insertion efficiency factor